MGRSIRSKRGRELRRIQRQKLEAWDLARIQKLSNALANTEKIKYTDDDGQEKMLTEEEKKTFITDKLDARMEVLKENEKEEETVMQESPENMSTTKLLKTGIPKRKKRHTLHKKNKKKKNKNKSN